MAFSKRSKQDLAAWDRTNASVQEDRGLGVGGKPRGQRPPFEKRKTKLNLDAKTLKASFSLVEPHGELLAKRFYQKLFQQYPQLVPMFENTSEREQYKKLFTALKLIVKKSSKPKALKKVLKELGRRHQSYGALAEHYPAVATTLTEVLRDTAGRQWTNEMSDCWVNTLEQAASVMLSAYQAEDHGMLANKQDISVAEPGHGSNILQGVIENAMTAIMMIDRDLIITYANKATTALLAKHEQELQELFEGFSVEGLIGTCIDIFHSNPAHQRQLLSNPANLPFSTDIVVGSLIFRINVTAIFDGMGEYIGNSLEWSDVTVLRAKQNEARRLQGTVDGAMTAIMMIDRDFNITYVNESTRKLLRDKDAEFSKLFPGYPGEDIVGINIDIFHKNPKHQRQLLSDPANLPYKTDIKVGSLKFELNVTAIIDIDGNYIGNALEWSDVTAVRKKEREVARLQSAVDGATANVMLCDADLNITYVNPAVIDMLKYRQAELQKIWPDLDADDLIGVNIDRFHQRPEHQRALLGDPTRLPFRSEITIDEVAFEVNATMIKGPNGEYMGNMVEWKDLTEQKDAESQIQVLIADAVAGRLDNRLQTDRYKGFMRGLSEGVNELMDAIIKPTKEITKIMQGLAIGDLTETMSDEYEGEFLSMGQAVNESISNLRNMAVEILSMSENIAIAAGEIAQGNGDLSQRTEEQASSLEETASSLEELTETVQQNADSASEASKLALQARGEAEKGGDIATRTIAAMVDINSSSKEIADIIGVIDEIAFQTNLLALNAAVEAARAGEQGRGFAVVASEVRSLAQRSASAAKEIKALISNSVEKVEEGARLVNDSGQSLGEIVGSVAKVSDLIAEIAASNQEQASGILQVNKAVSQMDEMTQQNAALVEEAAATSESLDDQTRGLRDLMEFFNTGEQHVASNVPNTRRLKVELDRPAPRKRNTPSRQYVDDEWDEF